MNRINKTASAKPVVAKSLGPIDRGARWLMARRLGDLRRGTVTLSEGTSSTRYGESADLSTTIRVHRSRFFRDTLLGGTMSVGESYGDRPPFGDLA